MNQASKTTLSPPRVILPILLLSLSGCVVALVGGGVAAGAATVAYIRGELQSQEKASINKLWLATNKAVRNLGFKVQEKKKDSLAARLTAKKADGEQVIIKLDRVESRLTKLRIRVGVFGNEDTSRLILNKIRRYSGSKAYQPTGRKTPSNRSSKFTGSPDSRRY